MNNINETLTKVVVAELLAKTSRKSSGTKIATSSRIIPVTVVAPFSL